MKCFYHPDRDAVGACAQCGKAACRECIEDVGQTLLCRGCLVHAVNQKEAKKQQIEANRQLTREVASQKLRFSKKLFFIVAILATGFSVLSSLSSTSDPKAPSPLLMVPMAPLVGLVFGYLVWSCYWGMPPIWRGWWGMFRRTGCFLVANPLTWLFVIVALFEIPVVVGYMYGVCGGGIYEYFKCKRVAESQ